MDWTPSKQKHTVDLDPKGYIVVHQVPLQWMLADGFKVTKIHRTLQVNQKPYMKTFIDTFVSKRSEAKKIQKEIFKIILNSAFGKICESVCHRSRCEKCNQPK